MKLAYFEADIANLISKLVFFAKPRHSAIIPYGFRPVLYRKGFSLLKRFDSQIKFTKLLVFDKKLSFIVQVRNFYIANAWENMEKIKPVLYI